MDRAFTKRYLWLASLPLLTLGLWAEWQSFFHLWYESIIYNHGFLVLAGIVFLLYLRKESLKALTINGSPMGLFLLAGSIAVLILSQAADIRVFRLMLVPLTIIFWGWSVWGKAFV
ncbi:MAG: archaeosortase/exosortase family protein, partial [Marinobacter sp.]|nr:archaeosortase/exosortase family protein [Marinobacter sp.]